MIMRTVLSGCVAMAFASGVMAEDAVKPDDPLQMAPVNACDVYGTGYTQIAGTNTCIKVSGQARYEKRFGQDTGSRHSSSGRFTLDFETRSD